MVERKGEFQAGKDGFTGWQDRGLGIILTRVGIDKIHIFSVFTPEKKENLRMYKVTDTRETSLAFTLAPDNISPHFDV